MRMTVVLPLLAVALAVSGAAGAKPPVQTAAEPAAAAKPAPANPIEPQATAALQNMGRYLQTLQAFNLKASTATDQVLTTGQKIQLDAEITMSVRRPDRLRALSKSDRRTREFFFDGNTLTMFSAAHGYYTKAPSPGTLKELVERIHTNFGLRMPLADLFTWSADGAQVNLLTSASAIGPATVRGTPCDQYAFRQDGLDWQLWIQRGDKPLPRRLVLVTTSDTERPQHSVELDWEFPSELPESTFAFVPPPKTHEIPWKRIVAAGGKP